MLTIEPINLHWMGTNDARHDLCAHGGVIIRLGNEILVDHRHEVWTLSAAALYLLRTLVQNHTSDHRVGEHLFPCCGHAMYAQEDSDDVMILGCANGLDVGVFHHETDVRLSLPDQKIAIVPYGQWRDAIVAFSDTVELFYTSSAEKVVSDEDAAGFACFMREWRRRRLDAGDSRD